MSHLDDRLRLLLDAEAAKSADRLSFMHGAAFGIRTHLDLVKEAQRSGSTHIVEARVEQLFEAQALEHADRQSFVRGASTGIRLYLQMVREAQTAQASSQAFAQKRNRRSWPAQWWNLWGAF